MKNKINEFDEIGDKYTSKFLVSKLKKKKVKKPGFATQKKIMEASGYYQNGTSKKVEIIDRTKLNKKNQAKNGIIR